MNNYLKLSVIVCLLSLKQINTQERHVTSLRAMALDKSVEILHEQLIKPQTAEHRTLTLDYWQGKAGVLLQGKANPESNHYHVGNDTILDRLEQKYFNRFKTIATFDNHICKAISGDCTKVVMIDMPQIKKFYLADIKTKTPLQNFVDTSEILQAQLTDDDTKAVSINNNSDMKIWDVASGKHLQTVPFKVDLLRKFAITNHNKLVIPCNGNLKVYDINTQNYDTIPLQTDATSAALSHDNTKIIIGTRSKTVEILQANTGERMHTLDGHQGAVISAAVSDDDKIILSGSVDGTAKVWDLNSGSCLRTITCLRTKKTQARVAVLDVALTSNNDKAITTTLFGGTDVWDIKTGEKIHNFRIQSLGKIAARKNLLAVDNTVYQGETWQEIVYAMPLSGSINAAKRSIAQFSKGIMGFIKHKQ